MGHTPGRREQGLSTNRRPPCHFSNSTGCPLSLAPPPVHPSASARNSTRMLPVGSAQHRKAAGVEISRFWVDCVHSRPPVAPARSAPSQTSLSQQSAKTSSNVFTNLFDISRLSCSDYLHWHTALETAFSRTILPHREARDGRISTLPRTDDPEEGGRTREQ